MSKQPSKQATKQASKQPTNRTNQTNKNHQEPKQQNSPKHALKANLLENSLSALASMASGGWDVMLKVQIKLAGRGWAGSLVERYFAQNKTFWVGITTFL